MSAIELIIRLAISAMLLTVLTTPIPYLLGVPSSSSSSPPPLNPSTLFPLALTNSKTWAGIEPQAYNWTATEMAKYKNKSSNYLDFFEYLTANWADDSHTRDVDEHGQFLPVPYNAITKLASENDRKMAYHVIKRLATIDHAHLHLELTVGPRQDWTRDSVRQVLKQLARGLEKDIRHMRKEKKRKQGYRLEDAVARKARIPKKADFPEV